jgi:nucleoside-diphosphate-sugar epimerase
VFASTSEVYAGTLKHFALKIPTPENSPLTVTELSESRSSYMLSKIYGEALCRHSGLPITIVRPHNIYGPRMGLSHVIPELLKKAYYSEDGTLEVFSPDHTRTFCYVDDAVEIIRRLAESEASSGQAFNVGNESPEISMAELAGKIVAVAGRDLQVIAGATTAGSPRRRCPGMSRTFDATKYRPQVELDDGLKRTFDWYQANVFQSDGPGAI